MNETSAIRRAAPPMPVLSQMLRAVVARGSLQVIDWKDRAHEFGDRSSRERCVIRITDPLFPLKALARPSLALGEAYMNGAVSIERGDLRTLLKILTSGLSALDSMPLQRLRSRLNSVLRPFRRNPVRRARRNASHHYDLSGELYRLFLDRDMQYSCAYFPTGEESLEEAQAAKKRHLAAKLLVEPGANILDIGSGWGGLALDLARGSGASVKGVTLSTEQLKVASERAMVEGLHDRVRFELQDYREIKDKFERIVSVGMFEHVGPAHYDEFFGAVARLLKPGGVALLHSIGRRSPPGGTDPWISKYIFPGGYIPSVSEVMAAVERSGLWATDIEILRLHYAETLRHWYERFQANRDRARQLYDERFCRMWEFYLAGCEMMFRNGELMVFQIQLAHERDAVPLTRDYVTDFERAAGPVPAGKTAKSDAAKPAKPVLARETA